MTYTFYRDIIVLYLLMDKLEVAKHIQWKVLILKRIITDLMNCIRNLEDKENSSNGITQRAMHELFEKIESIKKKDPTKIFSVFCSYL